MKSHYKNACKKGSNIRSETRWDSEDEENWNKQHFVICPSEVWYGFGSQLIHIWLGAPEWCPYSFEHLLNEYALDDKAMIRPRNYV